MGNLLSPCIPSLRVARGAYARQAHLHPTPLKWRGSDSSITPKGPPYLMASANAPFPTPTHKDQRKASCRLAKGIYQLLRHTNPTHMQTPLTASAPSYRTPT